MVAITRCLLGGCLAAVLAGCSEDTVASEPTSMCRETEQCMLDECRDEFEALFECIEANGNTAICDPPNLAHGRCLEDCGHLELPEEDKDAAFALYLCEVSEEGNDCSEQAMACGPAS